MEKKITAKKNKPRKKKVVTKSKTLKNNSHSYSCKEKYKYAKLEKEYGKFEGESYGWLDN